MERDLKTNAVRLSPDEQYQIRKSIIRLWKMGKGKKEIAEIEDVTCLPAIRNEIHLESQKGSRYF